MASPLSLPRRKILPTNSKESWLPVVLCSNQSHLPKTLESTSQEVVDAEYLCSKLGSLLLKELAVWFLS